MKAEYDFAHMKGGVRGKYVKRLKSGSNLILLSPDVAKYFHDDRTVNDALRSLVTLAKSHLKHAH